MRLERRVPAPEAKSVDRDRRDAAEQAAARRFPDAEHVDLCRWGDGYLAFPFYDGVARAHELDWSI